MATWMTRHSLRAAMIAAVGIFSTASAQTVPVVPQPFLPSQNLTPQQQQALYLRSLQSRSRGGVRTGYPQFIPFGEAASAPVIYDEAAATPSSKDTAQKRAEKSKAREERKKAAAEEAKAKKAKAVKKPVKDAKDKKAPKKTVADKN
jgi:hypothetical protein